MENMNCCFCWGDNWWIDGNNAWLVDGERDILYCINLITEQCEFIKSIPNFVEQKFRQNPRCIKYQNAIVCMPDFGQYIWIYSLNRFDKIEIKNPNKTRILISNFWEFEQKLYAVSEGLKQIIEINIDDRKIDNYYNLNVPDIEIAGSDKVNEKIFIVSKVSNCIYEFDLKSKGIVLHKLSEVKDRFYGISFDGSNFWLSGYNKAVYIWNKENNTVEIIKNFPEEFGIYDYEGKEDVFLDCKAESYDTPVFKDVKVVNQYVWFIPFKTNKIVYINKDTFEIFSLDIKQEDETKNSLARNYMGHKFIFLYIRENRYIGLFSFKNNKVLEIDTVRLQAKDKAYSLTLQCMSEISKNRILGEFYFLDKTIYKNELLLGNSKMIKPGTKNVGTIIYENC